ncbi:Co2+/Mg2+ efflux protein ApaG [Chondrinema litorale]|uniref:Co2+/Mg2+ efflux protein ApaG n=1 Tax=Chondrinema litorale TaxID=2994555 RepID=UPI0025448820|nr:Co2+/Mg2+ efflux protein ApaG [Chondrinema litorale]UZR94673.1 Co2+/Mg2+ efflux protein ApaG [Chondrinema litorale]|tara:strand:- start:10 stop:396 length:387 start_codon:yes stop_codon:yes gene_type:complete
MFTQITEGIKVSVVTEYQQEYSSPKQYHYVFTYKIKIENNSEYTVQLLRRKWSIFDSDGVRKEVEGDGVVGQQPVIEPGEMHQYVSGCNLKTGIGKMKGYYLIERMIDGKKIEVSIPEFSLIVPFKMN